MLRFGFHKKSTIGKGHSLIHRNIMALTQGNSEKMKTALLAIHYQNDVLVGANELTPLAGNGYERRGDFCSKVEDLLALARQKEIAVISARIAFRADHADVIQNCRIFRECVTNKVLIDGSVGADFHEGLGPQGGEFVIKHTRTNAFYGSQLEEILTALGIERLIIAGVSTNSAVITTVSAAADMGYQVIVAKDACSTAERQLHDACLENMLPIADVLSHEEIRSLLS